MTGTDVKTYVEILAVFNLTVTRRQEVTSKKFLHT